MVHEDTTAWPIHLTMPFDLRPTPINCVQGFWGTIDYSLGHAAGFRAVLRSSCTKHKVKMPMIYVVLSTVRAVVNPALSMRYPVTRTQNGCEMKPNRKYVLKAASRSWSVAESAMMAWVWGPRDEVKAL